MTRIHSIKKVVKRFMRKNILIFGHSYGPQFIDINNQYTALFDKNKYNVTVAYLIGRQDSLIEKKHTADNVIFLNFKKRSIRYLKISLILKILALCKKNKYELVICHRYKPTYTMLWVAQFYKIPAMIFVMHELGSLSHFTRKLTVAALGRHNMLFAGVSNAVRDDLRKNIWQIPSTNVITLHNMLNAKQTEAQLHDATTARQTLALPAKSFIFGTIGRLAINKDQKTLIRAFANIKSQCPYAKLVIAGDGQLESELKILVTQLNITHDVIFTGFLADAYRYVKAFNVFILSSIQEAFGLVLLEAMAGQVPIIATHVNGIPEVVGDAGTIIPPDNIDQLAHEMLNAYKTSTAELQSQGKKGYYRVMNEFSFDRFNEIFWALPLMKKIKEST